MKPIAILGASGFVGVRLVEMLHLGSRAPLRPIVYRPAGLAPLARFSLDWRVADYNNPAALTEALEGCETLVHLATGDPKIIRALTTPIYEAADRAGVKRMIFTSSASVHGQAPLPGTTEATPLPRHHQLPYNAAKADAERMLRDVRKRGRMELVVLRPGIVWGPRSRWVMDTLRSMKNGSFGWLDGGRGIINPIYVDNLVQAIECACRAPVDGGTFLLNDPQPANWREFFTPWLKICGLTPEDIPEAPPFVPAKGLSARFERVRVHPLVQGLAPKIPGAAKRAAKALVGALPEPSTPTPFASLDHGRPQIARLTEEMTLLERCAWRFPVEPAMTRLGWQPEVDWPTAVERTLGWLRFAGMLPPES